jgi:hypothetical protein
MNTYDRNKGETSGRMSKQFAEDVLYAPHMYEPEEAKKAKEYLKKFKGEKKCRT